MYPSLCKFAIRMTTVIGRTYNKGERYGFVIFIRKHIFYDVNFGHGTNMSSFVGNIIVPKMW